MIILLRVKNKREEHIMIFLTHLPFFVAIIFRGMPGVWKNRHKLIFCWFVYTQALTPNKKTVAELCKWSPAAITEWRFRRFLDATYVNIDLIDVLRDKHF